MTDTAEKGTQFFLTTPKGWTASFNAEQIETLVRLGLIEHERDGYMLEDGVGNGVGPLHHFYRETTVTSPAGHRLTVRMTVPICECGLVLGGHEGTALDWHAQHLAEHVTPSA